MSEYVHHYSKIQVNNVAKVRDWLQAGSLPKTSLPLQTSNEVTTEAERMKTLSLNEARGGELNCKAEDAISKVKKLYRADEPLTSRCKKLKNNVSTNVSSKTTNSEERHCICRDCSLNKLRSMFPKLNPHQLYQVLIKNQFDLQKAIESLLDIPQSSTKSRSQNTAKTGSSFPEYGTFTLSGNAVSETSRTEPIHHLRTEITANSRTERSSQTVSGTNSSVVPGNVTRTTPHSFDTCSAHNFQRSHQGDIRTPLDLLSPSRSTPAMPPGTKCAVCFSSLAGCRINQDMYQCVQGHLLCEDCNEKEWLRGYFELIDRTIDKPDPCLPDYGAVTHTGNAVSSTTRTEPIHHLRTEITANSRTRRSSPTVSGTKSSLVSSNVTSSTPHSLETSSILTGQRSRQVYLSSPVSPMSPSQPAAPAMPPCPECPVCFTSLAGSRIYQCAQGHSLCGDCNENPQVKNCPTCRGKLMGRATNMEQLLASIYSGE